MIKPIGFSIGTQGLNSVGNFVISLLIVRLASIESFGQYVYIFAIGALASSITNSLTGGVYTFYNPRYYARVGRAYQQNYNAFNLLIMALATVAASALAFWLSPVHEVLAPYVIPVFILSFIAIDNLRLQASANGLHGLMFNVELARLALFGIIVAGLSWNGDVDLGSIMVTQGLTGLAACAVLFAAFGTSVKVRRFGWVARRHIGYGQFLLPANLIGFFHSAGIQLIAGHHFGAQAIGLLRLAELPFSALNPLKQSMAFFLPRAMYDFDRRAPEEKKAILMKIGIAGILASSVLMACAWYAAKALIPILTGKEYPAGAGLIFCVAYVFAFLMTPLHIYLNTVGKARKVLEQTIIGSVVALSVYFATYGTIGYVAAAVASCACFFAITVCGAVAVYRHNAGAVSKQRSEGTPEARAAGPASPTDAMEPAVALVDRHSLGAAKGRSSAPAA